jgi:hypothetical protein
VRGSNQARPTRRLPAPPFDSSSGREP